ncbi:MAG TPA: DUF3306 domain-containing protein, partial [Ramlibacter sp.]
APPPAAPVAVVPSAMPSPMQELAPPATDDVAPAATREPPPTLDDVARLVAGDDIKRFVAPDVEPAVKNAALKKLFAEPHFNVMDGLDTYIDDYSKPDPSPPEMLKSLVSGKFLGLFEEKKEEEAAEEAGKAPTDREVADDPAPETVAQSSTRTGQALPPADDHADPDLRLQQDDAPGPRGPGAGAR